MTKIYGPVTVTDIARSDLTQENLSPFPLYPEGWRVHDNMDLNLPDPPASGDDLGIVSGTYGSATPSLQTPDLKAAGATTQYARRLFQVPMNYVAGQTMQIVLHAGMLTTVADTTATADVQCFLCDGEAGVTGSDLCTTAAQTINSLTLADKTFNISATDLEPGDWLDIRIALAINDGATATAVKGIIGKAQLLCDTKG